MASPIDTIRFSLDAQRELEQALKGTKPTSKRRHLENAMRQAEAHFYQGVYPVAVTYAQQALSLMREMDAHPDQDVARLDTLHTRLLESSFGNDSDVAQFGVTLLMLQRPDIFKK